MASAEIDFPRGGTSKILFRTSQHEHGNADPDKSRKRNKRVSDRNEMPKSNKKRKQDEDQVENVYANVFRQKLKPELLVQNIRGLAFVKFINQLEVILECVDGIQLKLAANRISRIFTSQMINTKATLDNIFHKGQAFAFKSLSENNGKVKEKRKKSEIIITTCPYEVNSHLIPSVLLAGTVLNGIISSIEEKGAIIDLGFTTSTANGFVCKEDLPTYLQLEHLHIGQVAMFRVKEQPSADTRVIKLTGFVGVDPLDESAKLEGKQLMPGTIVKVQPEKVVYDGIFVGIKNGPKAYIRKVHLPPRIQFDQSRIIKSFNACILCSQPNTPLIIMSAHPDITALSKIEKRLLPPEIKIGSRINATLYHVDKQQNVYFKLDDQNYQQMITAKSLRVNIDNIDEELPKYSIGSEHLCRVLGYSSVDRQLFVSTKSADLNKSIVTAEDALPGTRLKGTIKAISQNGMLVNIGDDFSGFVSVMHVLDKPDNAWQKRFHIGQDIWCRVLFTDALSNRLFLTAKSSMVKKTGAERIITKYDKQFEGTNSTGVVIKLLEDGGLLIAFFNRVAGILHKNLAAKLPATAIQMGTSVKVRVRSVKPEIGQMVLELPEEKNPEHPIGSDEPIKSVMKMKKQKEKEQIKKTKLVKQAKPFRIYTATVVGSWSYGGTSAETTIELLLPGGAVGRLHVSEFNNLNDFADCVCPTEKFLQKYKGKTINIKVICVSKNNAFTKAGRQLLMELRQTDRIVECTAREDKLQESRKKLTLLNYRSDFTPSDLVPIFIVSPKSGANQHKCIYAEINPDYQAIIPYDQIKIPSMLEQIEELRKQQSSVEITAYDVLDKGEMYFGRVTSVNSTKRGKIVQMELMASAAESDDKNRREILEANAKKATRTTLSGSAEKKEQAENMEEQNVEDEDIKVENDEDKQEGGSSTSELDEEEEEELDSEEKEERGVADENIYGEQLANPEEYERMIKAQSNSTQYWTGYIHYFLSKAKPSAKKRYECGKEVAERALKTIAFQNESDLENIWKIYLNLEVLLGTEKSLNECFKRACASCKSLEMHKYLINLLEKQANAEGREEEIREYYNSMINKFRHTELEPWFIYAKHLLKQGDAHESRQLLYKAFQCTPKKKHLTILGRFISLEEKYGDAERAKTMQEIVKNYKESKKQLDIRFLERAIGGPTHR